MFKKAAAGIRGKLISTQMAKAGKALIDSNKRPTLKDTVSTPHKGSTKGIEAVTGSEVERRPIAVNRIPKG